MEVFNQNVKKIPGSVSSHWGSRYCKEYLKEDTGFIVTNENNYKINYSINYLIEIIKSLNGN